MSVAILSMRMTVRASISICVTVTSSSPMTVSVASTTMRVSVRSENCEPDEIDEKANGADSNEENGLLNAFRDGDSLDGLNEDGEAKGEEKHGVNKSTQNLSTSPAKCILR